MTTSNPKLASLNKQSTETQIINEIRSMLASCDGIKEIIHFYALNDGKSRKFLIEVDNFQNLNKAIELLEGLKVDCRTFAKCSILLEIAD